MSRRKPARRKPATKKPTPPQPAAVTPTLARTSRAAWIVLAIILLAAGALRVAYLVEIAQTPDFHAPGRDALYHDYWARALATGDWTPPEHKVDPEIRTTPYLRPPVYPYFLAGVHLLSGGSHLAWRIAQMTLGLLNVVLAFLLGRAAYGSRVGLVFAGLMASYWIFVYYEGELHAPVLEVVCVLSLVLVLRLWSLEPTRGRIVAGGLVLGLFALVRPNALLLAPAVLGWLLWLFWRRGKLRRAFLPAALLTASVTLAVAPATVRNLVAADDFALVTTGAGINLYLSHHEDAGTANNLIPGLRELAGLSGWTCFEYPAVVRGVARALGQEPESFKHSAASSYFSDLAWSFIRDHPGKALRSAALRALLFWGPAEISNDEVVHYDRRYSAVLRRIPVNFSLVLTLAVLGLAVALAHRHRDTGDVAGDAEAMRGARFELTVLLVLIVAVLFVSVLPVPMAARYRVPVIPGLLLFAAYGLVSWGEAWRRGAVKPAALAALGAAVLYGVLSRPWIDYEPDEAVWHFNLAASYESVDDPENAIDAYRRALEIDAGRPEAHSNLGSVLARRGDTEAAAEHFRAALELDPEHAIAHHNLATLLIGLDRRDEALHHVRRAVAIRPEYESARRKLVLLLLDQARVLAERGDAQGAVRSLSEAIEIEPDDARTHYQLGMTRAQAGDLEGAAGSLAKAVELDPQAAPLEMNLGNLLAMLERFDEAAVHFRRAVELDPAAAGAHRNLAMTYARLGRFGDAAAAARAGAEVARRGGNEAQARELDRLQASWAARLDSSTP